MTLMTLPPLSLYVHFPWCIQKCPYCDFNSHPLRGDLPQHAYVDRLIEDLECELPQMALRPIESVFFGGGTPSLFEPAALSRLLAALRARATLAEDVEVTLEANPGAVDRRHFDGYLAAGINRLSIGAQSFAPQQLHTLGRIHGPDDIGRAVSAARAAGFKRINLDIMHGLPGQRVADAVADLEAALALGIDHLSWYQLTIEPKTQFARQPPVLPADDTLADIEEQGLALLAAAGLARYEVSAFAHPGQQARHNVNYWRFGDYIGLGAGAHGKRTDPAVRSVLRTAKPAQPRLYMDGPAARLRTERAVTANELPGEFALNALRLVDGVAYALFEQRTGQPLNRIAGIVNNQVERGLLRPDRFALTPLGLRFLDSAVAEYL
jgi:putative oxygen-independent coproporphyrinogen III oxidase